MRKERVFVPALRNQWLLSKAKGKLTKINGRTFPVASKTPTKPRTLLVVCWSLYVALALIVLLR